MRTSRSLAFKLLATGSVFLLVALGSIALTLWVAWQLEGGAAAVNEAGRMRMMSYRLAFEADQDRARTLQPQVQAMDATMELLRGGDPSRPLFIPWSDASRREFDAVQARWPSLRARWLAGEKVTPEQVASFVAGIDAFVSVIEQRLSHWIAVLRAFQLAMVAVTIGSAVLLLYASHLLVLDPLRRIGHGLASIRAGDFSARVQLDAADEFGELASGFNTMAEHLAAFYRNLEAKVAEKTSRLEVKRQRLSALYEVSAFVARAETLDALARGFAGMVRRIAGADAVAIRWSDEPKQHSLLLAQDGLPPALAALGQCLRSGKCHCGQPAALAGIKLVDVSTRGGALRHCGRAGFETLLTVPVRLHHSVLGEIDLFFRTPREFDDEERSLIETLAGHLAGGIEGLRVAAAEREAAVAGERTLLAQELHDSIAQSLAFLKIQVGLLRDALKRDDASATQRTLAEIDAGVRESYGDVRELLVHFRTRTSAEDIEPALRSTLQKFEHQTGVKAQLQMHGHGVPLPADVQVQVLHVLQEALSNVRKHAHTHDVRVTVQQTPNWRFEVADDGRGFDLAADLGENHVGLRIMRERAATIGATVDVRSTPGGGTVVVLDVPAGSGGDVLRNIPEEVAT
jgi:two-component system nitrate/nitrite sensor histidine kinase NarX